MTDNERDREYEESEWWRVPALPVLVIVLVFLVPLVMAWWVK